MATFEHPGPSDDCVECAQIPAKRSAVKILAIADHRIPLCGKHLEALCNGYAADSLVSTDDI